VTAVVRQKLTLGAVQTGRRQAPSRVLIYGPEGVGKTRFASEADGVLLLDFEEGSNEYDVARLGARKLAEVEDILSALLMDEHDFKVLAIDTVDRLETLVHDAVCEREGKTSIEGFGYGKGFQIALDEWRRLLARLDELRVRRGIGILLLGHAAIRKFQNPQGDDFDRYQLRLHEKAGGLVKEWCDVVGFAQFEVVTKKDDRGAKAKGVATGDRYLYTQRDAAYDAKSRYPIPQELPFSWTEFAKAMRAARAQKEAAK